MSKGISTIIATILLLIITIGLVGTAYVFISGMLVSRISKTIDVLDASCNGTHITLIISNLGTERIESDEIKIYVNNQGPTSFGKTIDSHSSEVQVGAFTGLVQNTANTLIVMSPSNSVRQTVWC